MSSVDMSVPFIDDAQIAALTASMLIEIGAVNFRADKPYIFTSGLASPVYIDCRKIISYPRVRSTLMDFAVTKILRDIGFEQLDAIAGGETAGIPFAAWLAERLGLPMQYVRKEPKGFGRGAQIEGDLTEGQRVLLVEDLATNGGSKVQFCKALRDAGAQTRDAIVVFYYAIFPETRSDLEAKDIRLHQLATWWDVLGHCQRNNHFDEKTLDEVEKFLHYPLEWSKNHGGVSELAI